MCLRARMVPIEEHPLRCLRDVAAQLSDVLARIDRVNDHVRIIRKDSVLIRNRDEFRLRSPNVFMLRLDPPGGRAIVHFESLQEVIGIVLEVIRAVPADEIGTRNGNPTLRGIIRNFPLDSIEKRFFHGFRSEQVEGIAPEQEIARTAHHTPPEAAVLQAIHGLRIHANRAGNTLNTQLDFHCVLAQFRLRLHCN